LSLSTPFNFVVLEQSHKYNTNTVQVSTTILHIRLQIGLLQSNITELCTSLAACTKSYCK